MPIRETRGLGQLSGCFGMVYGSKQRFGILQFCNMGLQQIAFLQHKCKVFLRATDFWSCGGGARDGSAGNSRPGDG